MKTKTLLLSIAAVVVLGAVVFMYSSLAKPPANYGDPRSPVMYFYGESCHYCEQQEPILGTLAGEGFRVKLMDVGVHPEYWQQYGVSGTPMFMALNGDRRVGLTGEAELRQWLSAHDAKIAAANAW